MLSIILTLLNRKKLTLLWSFLGVGLCNAVFFFSSVHKTMLLDQYTSSLPKFSDKDIFIVSNESEDVLHPSTFSFPHTENVRRHEDVLGVSALAMMDDKFVKTEENPELLVISLKSDANSEKWMETFKAKPEYVAIHSGHYKHMYNKAIVIRNRALRAHFALLAMISLGSLICAGLFSASSVFKLYDELRILLLEGISGSKVIFGFWFCLSKLSGIATFVSLGLSLIFTSAIYVMIQMFIHTVLLQTLSILLALFGVVLFAKGGYGKNRV